MFKTYAIFSKLKQLMANNNEFAQSFARNIFTLSITCYLYINHADHIALTACYIYLVFGLAVSLQIYFEKQAKPLRKWIMMVLDIGATSLAFSLTAQYSGIYIGVYLWLILGYGLRYGSKLFVGTYTSALFGFLISTHGNPYWQSHQDLKYGFLITMILIPIYTLKLLVNFENEKRKANEASAAKTAFLSHMSHEIRTPINGVIGATELLSQTTLTDKQKAYVEMTQNSASSLKKLINNVLDISKIEQGKVELEKIAFNFEDTLKHIQTLFSLQATHKGIKLNTQLNIDSQQTFLGSSTHIEQVLINLVGNAIKFTETGEVNVTVSAIESYPDLSKIEIQVNDTGIGISEKSLETLFDSFVQADNSITRRFGGSGLGTTIAKQLTELMGGEISVSSQLDVGSTFTVKLTLPHAQESSIKPVIFTHTHNNVVKLSTHNKYKKKLRVLIADDNVVNRMILSEVLQKQRCVVTSVEDGDEALDALEVNQFDLMILDYNMPGANGLDVFKIYHSLADSKPVKTFILTADATKSTEQKCLTAGVDEVLSKPIITQEIIKRIHQIQEQVAEQSPLNIEAQIKTETKSNVKGLKAKQKNDRSKADGQTTDVQPTENTVIATRQPIRPLPGEVLIDVGRLTHLIKLGNGVDFLHRLITQFISETDKLMVKFDDVIAANNIAATHEIAHSLAGESANLGLMPLSKISRTLMDLKPEDTLFMQSQFEILRVTYENTRKQLNLRLKKLSELQSNQ